MATYFMSEHLSAVDITRKLCPRQHPDEFATVKMYGRIPESCSEVDHFSTDHSDLCVCFERLRSMDNM